MDSEVEAVTEYHDPLLIRARARVGRVLREKWRLDVLLGVGGMAAVYAATHRNGSRVAVKMLHTELTINPQVRTRFLREGYVANAVGHEGAVKIIDDDTAEDGSLYLVTELLDGETLEDRRLRFGGKLSEDDVLSVADQLLDVLVAAHAKGVVHRDLKPENVFLTRTGQVKVLDFGIARLRELSSASTATKSGTSMGTPAYMSPEQARGLWDEVDGRSDLWAVGATLFHLLTGTFVHEGRTTNEQLLHSMTKAAPPLASVDPGISPSVARVVDRALAFERERRWADALRMQEGVRRAYHDRNGAPITTAPRLAVPESVPNRTLPDSQAAAFAQRLPTTGQPVETARNVITVPGGLSRTQVTAVLLGGMATFAIMVGAVVWFVWGAATTSRSAPGDVQVVAYPTAAPTPAPPASNTPTAPAPTAAPDLPEAGAAQPTAKTVPTGRPPASTATTATAGVPAAKPNCTPPYTIDKAGHRIPKPECD